MMFLTPQTGETLELDRIAKSPIGELVKIRGTDPTFGDFATFAYLPAPLPATIVLTNATWLAVTKAVDSLGALRQACKQLPNPRILVAPALAVEAISSSRLEGTYSTMEKLMEARLADSAGLSPETREVRAFDRIAHAAFDAVAERPISIHGLAELQGELARRSVKPSRDPGALRTHQVYIGPEGGPIGDARFVPPPPGDQLRLALEDWEKWLEEPSDLPVVVRAIMAHYQFETIHPFADGNGRIGRLVFMMQLLKGGCLEEAALSISPWLFRRRSQYQEHLFDMSCTGDWNPLIEFFCRGIAEQAQRHIRVADELCNWLSDVQHKIADKRWTGRIVDVVDDLVEWPVITAPRIQQTCGISPPSAHDILNRLVELGVLEEDSSKRPKIFVAPGVMAIVEGAVDEEDWNDA